jgi:hypothetical protein
MISAIVDVAHALAELSFASGDHRRARWAASRGLAAESCAEVLYQDALRAATGLGDTEDLERLMTALRARVGELDPEDDVAELTGLLTAVGLGTDRRM